MPVIWKISIRSYGLGVIVAGMRDVQSARERRFCTDHSKKETWFLFVAGSGNTMRRADEFI